MPSHILFSAFATITLSYISNLRCRDMSFKVFQQFSRFLFEHITVNVSYSYATNA